MITGNMLRDAIISGANNIANNRQQVDEMNVFPVPDGDTGTNMSMSISGAARELERADNKTVGEIAEIAASALLRGARGNSGVILSLMFRGISKGLKGLETAGGSDIAAALTFGVEASYKAVMKPIEGTILTVGKVAAAAATESANAGADVFEVWEAMLASANEAVLNTPELLPVLKKAGVVDAGGKGLAVIFEGMQSVFKDNVIVERLDGQTAPAAPTKRNAAAEFDEEIIFTYCTEYIVKREKSNNRDPLLLRAFLETMGDSTVVVDDEQIIKVHTHTDNPGKALQEGLKYGALNTIKIENMREQHEQAKIDAGITEKVIVSDEGTYTPSVPTNEIGFVAVVAGAGIEAIFKDLGADNIVTGGQTMNPSTDDILRAIELTPAKTVYVLPNNKNIIMAAEQTIHLATRKVIVIHTSSIPMGITAMLHYDPDQNVDENAINMSKAADNVGTGQITYAARNSEYDGHKILKDEILALENGKVAFAEKDMVKAVVKLTKKLYKKESAFITLIYGQDVSEEDAQIAAAAIAAKVPADAEITVLSGGQPVYYYIISVE